LAAPTYTENVVEIAGSKLHFLHGGIGEPMLILHRDIGNPGWLPFYEQLAQRFSVSVPYHPGFDKSERPDWMRNVRDLAAVYAWFLKERRLSSVHVVGLGFGGWVAAELATMNHSLFKKMVLVSAMGVQPHRGEIMDQFLVYTTDYIAAGFFDQSRMEQLYGKEPDIEQLVTWEINREMTTRIAWKPYMFNQALAVLLGGVDTKTLLGELWRALHAGAAARAVGHAQPLRAFCRNRKSGRVGATGLAISRGALIVGRTLCT
jgi:pimeloyl-ACP methyl ester carboxylesterase